MNRLPPMAFVVVVKTPRYRLSGCRWFEKIGEVYEVVELPIAVELVVAVVLLRLLVELTAKRSGYVLITEVDYDVSLYAVLQWCPHTWQHSLDVCDDDDEVVCAPTKAQQREILLRHHGEGRREHTPVGWLCMEMRMLS